MELRWYTDGEVRRRVRACLDAGVYNIRVSGDYDLVVGGTGMDPADEACHRIVINRSEGYAIVDPESENDEWAPRQGYTVGDFEQLDDIGWVPAQFGEDEESWPFLTFDEFLQRVATPEYWRTAFARLLDLDEAAHKALRDILRNIEPAAIALIGSRTAELGPLSDSSLDPPDLEAAWEAFTRAVRRRAPYAQFMEIHYDLWGRDNFSVSFGHRLGQPDEVLYRTTRFGLAVLGTFYQWGRGHDHEAAIAEAHPDPWERKGALAAARGLVEIHRAANAVRAAYSDLARREDDDLRALIATEAYLGEPGGAERLEEHERLWGRPALDDDQILERMNALVASEMARRPDGSSREA